MIENKIIMSTNYLDLFKLDDRRALVTGGSKGLGKVMATALAQAGADVAIASRNIDEGQAAASEISESTGRKVLAFQADVTKKSEVVKLGDQVENELGAVDILVNNAGVNIRGAATEMAEKDWDTVIEINLKAPFLCAQRFAPGMCERKWGRVINMGSALSVIALPGRGPYAASKAGVQNLSRVLAIEWATQGVTVNTICPGPFSTAMNKILIDDPVKSAEMVSRIPMGRWAEMHEITGAVLFLASDASSFVTGSSLFVDGGWTAQ
jgi:NAD(P)-dependent dehydrogenase (short-subunit alcohol dehydrogenase family)